MERGSITASCGCKIAHADDGEFVTIGEYGCDAIDGFHPIVVTGFVCPSCAATRKAWPEYLADDDAEDAWLDETHPVQQQCGSKQAGDP